MKLTGNTILITGGGSGIGRGLAEALHRLGGNQVIIAGRRREALHETVSANPGMKSLILDIEDPTAIRSFAPRLAAEYPALNVLINNAGIARLENVKSQLDLADAEAMITTNLLGPIRLTAALMPLLQKQSASTIMNVSSGLAFLPLALSPTYCATKAAIHSYTESLRYQLKGTAIEVLELIPPYVATDLMGRAADPRAMPLDKFIAEVMELLKSETPEICVDNAKPLRFAAANGMYDGMFQGFNDAMSVDN